MDSKLNVRISIRGRLSPRLTAGFDGLTPSRSCGATQLVGELTDQAQLHGLLSRIRDLGLELESVTVGGADPTSPEAQPMNTGHSP